MSTNNIGFIRVEPVQVVLYRSWYSVDSTCDTFLYTTDGVHFTTVTIPTGFLTIPGLLDKLQALMPGWLLGWVALTGQWYFQPPNDGNIYMLIFPNLAALLLGFPVACTSVPFTYYSPLISQNPAKITIENLILVHVNFKKQSWAAVDNLLGPMQESDIFVKVIMDAAPLSLCTWRTTGRETQFYDLAAKNIDALNVYLTDKFGRAINPACNWTLSFRVTIFETQSPLVGIQATLTTMNNYLHFLALDQYQRELKERMHSKARSKSEKKRAKS